MSKLILILLFAGAVFAVASAGAIGGQAGSKDAEHPSAPPGGTLRIISSSHQDIAWMDSPEKCMIYRDENCITPALTMMAKNPEYRFVMENMLNLMEYIDRHPERKAEILRYTKEGRMEWGATFNQPYESLLTGEELVREVYFGRRWLRKNFPGCDARVYFNPDVPGRALQMQQILGKSGVPYMVISRYHEGIYRWLGPDGTGVLAYSPGHYGNSAAILNTPPAEGVKAVAAYLEKWGPYFQKRNIPMEFPLLHSEDFSKPKDFGPLIGAWAGRPKSGPDVSSRLQYSSAAGFFKAIDTNAATFDRIMGERPNLWLYIHGPTHHGAITAHRQAGLLLPAAEIFATIESLLAGSFAGYPAATLGEAWKAAIYPDHGWGGKEGQITDRLFRKKYEEARDKGREALENALVRIGSRIKTVLSKGTPVAVFNSLSWTRTDPVRITIKKPAGAWTLKDGLGRSASSQILPPLPDQSSDNVRVEFVARDVPPVGYKIWYVSDNIGPDPSADERAVPALPTNQICENEFYKVTLAPGGVKSIFDKDLGLELLDSRKFLGFEVFTLKSVGNGAGEFGRVQQPTMDGFDKLSAHRPAWTIDAAESGPVKTVFVLNQPLPDCTIREKLIIYQGIKRIDCEIEMQGWDGSPYREFRLAVPIAAPQGRVAYEAPFGIIEVGTTEAPGTGGPAYGNLVYDEPLSRIRPREVQNFLNVSDDRFGLTLSTSVAVNDFKDPTADPVAYPVLQAVLLASRRSCHGEGNWYLQEGDHHFRFSIVSHAPGWRNGYKRGIQANAEFFPLVAPHSTTAGAPGFARGVSSAAKARPLTAPELPEEKSFVSVSASHVLIGTIKKAEDDNAAILRVYDIEGKAAEIEVSFPIPLVKAEAVNMIEEEGTPIPVRGNGLTMKVGRYAIETLKLQPRKAK